MQFWLGHREVEFRSGGMKLHKIKFCCVPVEQGEVESGMVQSPGRVLSD
jgi:hypothetical protein